MPVKGGRCLCECTWSSRVTSVVRVLLVFHFWLKLRPSSFSLYFVSRWPPDFPVSVLLEPEVANSCRMGAWHKLAAKENLRGKHLILPHRPSQIWPEVKYRFKTGKSLKESRKTDWAVRKRLCVHQRYSFKDKGNINEQTGGGLWYISIWSLHTHTHCLLPSDGKSQAREQKKRKNHIREKSTAGVQQSENKKQLHEKHNAFKCFVFKHGVMCWHRHEFKLHIWTNQTKMDAFSFHGDLMCYVCWRCVLNREAARQQMCSDTKCWRVQSQQTFYWPVPDVRQHGGHVDMRL